MKKIIKIVRERRYFILTILIIVLLNALSAPLFRGWRLDMTPTDNFSLSPKSKSVVSDLKDPVRIKLFFSKDVPAPYDRIEKSLREILWQYKNYAGRRFTYEFVSVDPSKGAESNSQQTAMQEGVYPVSVQQIEEGSIKMVQVYMGMSIHYGAITDSIPSFQSLDLLEFQITNLLDKVVSYQRKMQNLDHKIEVALYLPKDFVQSSGGLGVKGLDQVAQQLSLAVEVNNKKSFGKLEFKSYDDYGGDAQVLSWLDALGVNKIFWGAKKTVAQAALVVKNGENTAVYELLEPAIVIAGGQLQRSYKVKDLSDLEGRIFSLVNNVLKIKEQIAYLDDKGAPPLQAPRQGMFGSDGDDSESSLSRFYAEASKTYDIAPVKVKDLLSSSMKTLIIYGLKESMSDADLFQIDQFLMKGGRLIIFYEPFDIAPPSPSNPEIGLIKNQSNLDKLLNAYGISFEDAMVLDKRSYEAILPNRFGQQERRLLTYIPRLMGTSINHDYRPFKNAKSFFLAKMGSIELNEEKLKSQAIQVKKVLSSSPEAWLSKRPSEEAPVDGEMTTKAFAYLLKGRFHSYFESEGAPSLSGDFVKVADNGGSIFILSSASALSNVFFSQQQAQVVSSFMNVIDDLGGDPRWSDLRDKINLYPPIEGADESDSSFKKFFTSKKNLEIFNAFIIPSGLVFVGFYMMMRRKKYRKTLDKLSL